MPARRRVVAASGLALAALLIAAPADAANGARKADRADRTTTTTDAPRRSTTTTDPPATTSTTHATTSTTQSTPTTSATSAPPATTTTARATTTSSPSTTSTEATFDAKNAKRYVVVLKKGNSSKTVADDHAKTKHIKVERVFGNALRGYSADIPDNALDAVKHDKRVAYVERDQTMTSYAQILPWGVEQVSRNGDHWSSTHPGDGTGTVNMDVYVLDSGIQANPDLYGVTEYTTQGSDLTDCAGHGTFTAAIVGAKDDTQGVVGVAPGVHLHGVRVLDCKGTGTTTTVVAGLDWIVAHGVKPAVIQMSFGSKTIDRAFDDSITRALNAGFVITDAAGNSHKDACKGSPSHMGTLNGVITVGATTQKQRPAAFSDYGSCVDVWAPGVKITSDYLNGALAIADGTSASAPHVAGIAALYLSNNRGASPATVEAAIKSAAVTVGKGKRTILRASAASF